MTKTLTYTQQLAVVIAAGMEISDDGLAFTSAGGLLSDGEYAPEAIRVLNGYSVEEAAAAILREMPDLTPCDLCSEVPETGAATYSCVRCNAECCTPCSHNDPADSYRVVCNDCWTDEDQDAEDA